MSIEMIKKFRYVIVGVVGAVFATMLAVSFNNSLDSVNERIDSVDGEVNGVLNDLGGKVDGIVTWLSTTTTSTTTTTTTTTTLPPKPAGPAKSSLAAKIDEWSPGTSSQVSAAALQAGGKMACNMWEAGPTSRMSVMREVAAVMNLTPDQLNIAALVAQAVLYTGCRGFANFPEGPLPFDCMGNGKICD